MGDSNDNMNGGSYQGNRYQGGTPYTGGAQGGTPYSGGAQYSDNAQYNGGTQYTGGTQFYGGASNGMSGGSFSGSAANGMAGGQNQAGGTYMPTQISGDVFDDVFVEKSERTVATIGNGLVLNMISGEGLKKEQAVLTDKRLYYNHRRGAIDTTSTRECVNVTDITGTKITDNKQISFLIVAGLLFVIGLFTLGGIDGAVWFVTLFIFALILVAIFFVTWNKYLDIEYPGGRIRLKVKKYGMNNIIAFQKAIYRVKDAQIKELLSMRK